MSAAEQLSLSAEDAVIWTVSELTRAIRGLLEQALPQIRVRGELSNLTVHRSGHVYFSLKDSHSQVSSVWFRSAAAARRLELRNGLEVEVDGRVSVYEPRGVYQIIVDRMRTAGVGDLQRRFEELKSKLQAEGLFDAERKRAVPALPSCVGLVTSPDGAALRDFLQIVGRRFANLPVRVYPAAVQGAAAAAQIAAGIAFFNAEHACDVIVVTRGGGSLEDLWAFNEECVARAAAASTIPVISAVGHERDFTICDYVADLRVPTPSAAAELVIAAKAELGERLLACRQRLTAALRLRLSELRRRLERVAARPVLREPVHLVRYGQQRIDELFLRLQRACQQFLGRYQARLETLHGNLQALSPRRVLTRGYAILIQRRTGQVVRAAAEVRPQEALRGILGSGEIELTVDSVAEQGDG